MFFAYMAMRPAVFLVLAAFVLVLGTALFRPGSLRGDAKLMMSKTKK